MHTYSVWSERVEEEQEEVMGEMEWKVGGGGGDGGDSERVEEEEVASLLDSSSYPGFLLSLEYLGVFLN